MPDVFTTFFSDSVWTWVETIVNADGRSGEIGTGIGRVEFSDCKDIDQYKRAVFLPWVQCNAMIQILEEMSIWS